MPNRLYFLAENSRYKLLTAVETVGGILWVFSSTFATKLDSIQEPLFFLI
jgi:hypothetical protein